MPARGKVAKDAELRFRLPLPVRDAFIRIADSRGITASELLRQLVEREVLTEPVPVKAVRARRLRRLRRCVSCTAFVRNGYTCRVCRVAPGDSVVADGVVLPSPVVPRAPFQARPDMRDPRWVEAEALTLDAFAPVVAILYERLTGQDSYEQTDLDDIADLLAMAGSVTD